LGQAVARKCENVEELIHSIGQIDMADFDVPAPVVPDLVMPSASDPSAVPESNVVLEPGLSAVKLLHEFLAKMTLDVKESEEDRKDADKKKEKDQVTLLTLHGAKGLEYPVVYLVGMEEGFLPHKRTIEEALDFSEERRLCYVGITRARDHLVITRAKNRIRYGKPVPRYISRFMADVPRHLMLTKDESYSPDLHTAEAKEEHEVKVKNFLADIRARLQTGGG
jgi:superfamily I DNA/RNA helicase